MRLFPEVRWLEVCLGFHSVIIQQTGFMCILVGNCFIQQPIFYLPMAAHKLLLLLCLVMLSLATVVPHVGKVKSHRPRSYNVSLDASLEDRWRPIVNDYYHHLKLFMDYFELMPIPEKVFAAMDWYAHNMDKHQDFVAEIEAFANVSGYSFGRIFFLNYMYEFSTVKACSAILVRNSAGRIFHGRNLDFEMWGLLSRLVVDIHYHQGKKLVYSINTVLGSVFALTGIRYGAFAVNVDTRFGKDVMGDLVNILIEDAIPDVWLLRKVLEEEVSYENALQRLKTTRIGAPVYFIISGLKPNEGAVIERDQKGCHNIYTLNETTWFLVQTNYDRDQKDPFHDPRRLGVENRLRKYGNVGFSEKDLFNNFMTIWPTFNIATIMSAIMVPSTGYYNTTVWYAANPTGKQSPTI